MRLAAAVVLLMLLPAAAPAAPVPDVALAESTAPLDVGIDGRVVAWSWRVGPGSRRSSSGTGPALRGASAPGRTRAASTSAAASSWFPAAAAAATSSPTTSAANRSRVVVTGVRVPDVTVGAGRVVWVDGRRVRSHSLDGGPIRVEAVAHGTVPRTVGTDGTTLAVTGSIRGRSVLFVTRQGSGRARLRHTLAAERYVAYRSPAITTAGIAALLDGTTGGGAAYFAELPAGGRGFTARSSGGMEVRGGDRSGDDALLVAAPCNVGRFLGGAAEPGRPAVRDRPRGRRRGAPPTNARGQVQLPNDRDPMEDAVVTAATVPPSYAGYAP